MKKTALDLWPVTLTTKRNHRNISNYFFFSFKQKLITPVLSIGLILGDDTVAQTWLIVTATHSTNFGFSGRIKSRKLEFRLKGDLFFFCLRTVVASLSGGARFYSDFWTRMSPQNLHWKSVFFLSYFWFKSYFIPQIIELVLTVSIFCIIVLNQITRAGLVKFCAF